MRTYMGIDSLTRSLKLDIIYLTGCVKTQCLVFSVDINIYLTTPFYTAETEL